jgi:capsid protein
MPVRTRQISASYDAARDSDEFRNYWANADSLDADSANSRAVRAKLVPRSRYEVANNGFADGIVQTYATDLVGIGPSLRMKSADLALNQQTEVQWKRWAKATQLRRKLWCMAHAKVQDGEAFAIIRSNPRINHGVKLDLVLIETEQCHTPNLPTNVDGYIDGIKFDEFGNAEWYDVLKYHPGSHSTLLFTRETERIPARYMLHWFLLRRPGQHRAVPEFRSTLQVGAASRRWREATIAAAETAADISILLKTNLPPDGTADQIAALSSVEFKKRMMTAAPMGWDAGQMKAEHPNATYESFNKALINEQARPKSMPYNKAACDSSSYNYSSGRLDHGTYYGALDVEREDGNDLVLDPMFAVWWQEAVLAFGWDANPDEPPDHQWDWPKHPIADVESEANAINTSLRNGSKSLSRVYSEQGIDFEEEVVQMSKDFGISVDQMRQRLLECLLPTTAQPMPSSDT